MSGWNQVIGYQDLIDYLKKAVQKGTPSHAYIFSGPEGSGKRMLAKLFAQALTCEADEGQPCMTCHACIQAVSGNQPDIIHVRHEKPKTISVEEIRTQVVEDITIRPYARPYKVYIIAEAEKMTEQAMNALLKTLEDTPKYGVILLLTANEDALLPTIRSRCVTLKFNGLKDEQIAKYLTQEFQTDPEQTALCTAFAQGSLGKAVRLAQSEYFSDIRLDAVLLMNRLKDMDWKDVTESVKNVTQYKLEIQDFLDILAVWYRDVLMMKATCEIDRLVFKDEVRTIREQAKRCSYEGIEKVLNELKKAQERLRANVNFDLVMELLIATMKEN